MATVQLIAVRPGFAVVQLDNNQPEELTSDVLRQAQNQQDDVRYVYRWLTREYIRCEFEQRNNRAWTSPRRDIYEVVAEMYAKEAEECRLAEEHLKGLEEEKRVRKEKERREAEIASVKKRIKEMPEGSKWVPIPFWEVPDWVRFDTLGQDQGQIVEVSYGTHKNVRTEACPSDAPYKRIVDGSEAPGSADRVWFFKRLKESER